MSKKEVVQGWTVQPQPHLLSYCSIFLAPEQPRKVAHLATSPVLVLSGPLLVEELWTLIPSVLAVSVLQLLVLPLPGMPQEQQALARVPQMLYMLAFVL